MHSDQQEGFVNDIQTQLIDFNYQPSFRYFNYQTKSSYRYKKKPILQYHRLINSSIRNEWAHSLQETLPKNIVFNNIVKKDVSYFEHNISFISDFQSGNLDIVSRNKNNEYNLYMRPDTNTKAHFQWFYFKVNIKKGHRKIKFTIKNFIKATMLYSKGLKPYCKTLKNPDFHQYKQIPSSVKFYQDQQYYNLQYTFNFEYDDDQVEFCSQPPYTFEHLSTYIQNLSCKKLSLCKTVMSKKIPYLWFQAKKQLKAIVVVMGRQHPGEAVGSWMMEGFLNGLTSNHYNDYITWVVIPMLNIDGVILGNNRTGILGHDFNRNWVADDNLNSKSAKLFPQNNGVINLIKSLKKKYPRKVKMFLDLHGHSSQPNVFTYGPPHEQKSEYFYQCRLFPELLGKKNQNFSLNQCSYVLKPNKKNTARSVIFYNFGIPFTYTIESTFGIMRGNEVGIDDFLKMGEDIVHSAFQFIFLTVIKDVQETKKIIEQLKIKYADAKNGGQQYESASEESDEDENRKKIESIVLGEDLLQICEKKEIKRYEQKQQKKLDRRSLVHKSSYIDQNRQCTVGKSYTYKKKRLNTEGELLTKKECLFPNIQTKNTKLSFQQSFFTEEELKNNLKMEDIQKRLYKMRNSKIGKKILVINAYGI